MGWGQGEALSSVARWASSSSRALLLFGAQVMIACDSYATNDQELYMLLALTLCSWGALKCLSSWRVVAWERLFAGLVVCTGCSLLPLGGESVPKPVPICEFFRTATMCVLLIFVASADTGASLRTHVACCILAAVFVSYSFLFVGQGVAWTLKLAASFVVSAFALALSGAYSAPSELTVVNKGRVINSKAPSKPTPIRTKQARKTAIESLMELRRSLRNAYDMDSHPEILGLVDSAIKASSAATQRRPLATTKWPSRDLSIPLQISQLFEGEITGGKEVLSRSFYKDRYGGGRWNKTRKGALGIPVREDPAKNGHPKQAPGNDVCTCRATISSDLGPRSLHSHPKFNRRYSQSLNEYVYREDLNGKTVDDKDLVIGSVLGSDTFCTGAGVPSENPKTSNLSAGHHSVASSVGGSVNESDAKYESTDCEEAEEDLFLSDHVGAGSSYSELRFGDLTVKQSKKLRKLMLDWNFGEGGLLSRVKDPEVPEVFREKPLTTTFVEACRMFQIQSGLDIYGDRLVAYMECIEGKYQAWDVVKYHNSLHATCVLQSTCFMLGIENVRESLMDPALATFSTLFSAAVHDVAHPGTTQAFHVKTQSDLAVLYSDRSVLEHHHLAVAFSTMRENEKYNFLKGDDDMKLFREKVIQMVLATDLALHIENLEKLKELVESSRVSSRVKGCERGDENDKLPMSPKDDSETQSINVADTNLILCSIVHCCDIGNTMKDWSAYKQWIPLIFEEFFAQGDLEQDLGVCVSFDRETCFPCEMQTYFIDLFVIEFVDVMSVWCPAIGDTVKPHIARNKRKLEEHRHARIEDLV